jgi:hypothetical protein
MWSVPVARHHWTTKQLAYFKNNPSVGVEYAVWKDLIHSLDKQDYYEIQGTGKEKNSSSRSKIDSAIDKNTDLSLLEFSATRRCVSAPPRRHRPLESLWTWALGDSFFMKRRNFRISTSSAGIIVVDGRRGEDRQCC